MGLVVRAADLPDLECLDVFEPVDDPATEFDEFRAFARPPPTLQRAVRNVPASRQLDLGQVS